MKYEHLFFDLDHTLWDFDSNSKLTLRVIYDALKLDTLGVDNFDLFHARYIAHNDKLWDRYRNGYIKVDELRWKRMWLTLLDFKIGDEKKAREMGEMFLDLLPTRTLLFPDTIDVLNYLRDKNYKMHLITNGFEQTQHSKLKYSGMTDYFIEIITSEGSNSVKPNKEIFEYAFKKANAVPTKSIMLGDSLEADIQGAINAGIDQVFVNHLKLNTELAPTYTVHSLIELKKIF